MDRPALVGEAAGPVGHQPFPLRLADRAAQIGLAREAHFALAAFGGVERDDVIAFLDAGHPGPDLADDPGAFVAQDRGKQPFGIEPVERVGIGVADPARLDLDQYLARPGALEVEFDHFERLLGCEGDGGAGLHRGRLQGSVAPRPRGGGAGSQPGSLRFRQRGLPRRA